jgi:endo-1,4-beta-xylanase
VSRTCGSQRWAVAWVSAVLVALGMLIAAPAEAAKRPLLGTAVDMSALANDPTYARLTARLFDIVTPENVMKWETVEPQQGVTDFSQGDALVRFARANDQAVRGHTLVWHSQLPTWLTSGTFTPDQLRDILRRHIFEEAGHFRGRIYAWDVVNEAFNEDGTLRQTIWLNALGPGYIADAFRWAHQADPHAKLYYNDYNLESIGPKSDAALALVEQLKAQHVPIDGVGFQGHLGIQYPYPDTFGDNLKRFAAAGVDVAITEADVRMVLPVTPEKLATQATYFGNMGRSCAAVRRCVSFTLWGFTDKYSWVPGFFDGEGAATPFDEEFRPKPAWFALRDALSHR